MASAVKADPDVENGHEDSKIADAKPSYKSWKKKYRKMRIVFDQRMHDSEELHKAEQSAMRLAKKLAVENDRLMDLLMDINQSAQIPFERRVDLWMEGDEETEKHNEDAAGEIQRPSRALKTLVKEVPHTSFAATAERYPEILEDLDPKDPELYPTSFLSADDIDSYLFDLDVQLGLKPKPIISSNHAHDSPANFALRNPTSVYNWLRKHAPKTFLQDLEKDKDKDKEDGGHGEKGEGGSSKRKSTGRSGKRQSAAAAESMDWDEDANFDAPAGGSIRGKRKRDDDGGYRPKGGSSRPTKKRKSKDLSAGAPKTAKKSSA